MADGYSRAFAELGLSENVVRVLEHSYNGIIITLRDSTIIYVNNAYSRILGVPPEKLIGRKLSLIEPDSIVLKVLETGVESVHVSEHVTSLNEWIFGSVLLLPSPENFVGSISIITKLNQELTEKTNHAPRRYIEFFMDEILSLREPLPAPFQRIVGEDRKFRQALFKAYKASKPDFPVLVRGESGTGKELIVKAIHESSSRRNHHFVALNCAAITSTLVESELFGYESGSFTGAKREGKKGMFDHAHKGTLFFDEVGDFELPIQAKILRVLEEKTFRRVGGGKDISVDTRIISATNKDLEAMILNGRFREDLFYRINTMTVYIPPLRERGGDLELLANFFLSEFCKQYQKETMFSNESLEILYSYSWPGNVRELRNVVDYASNMAENSLITPKDLPSYLLLPKAKISLSKSLQAPSRTKKKLSNQHDHPAYKSIMDSFEKELIGIALQRSRNRTEAMKMLGLSRRAFYLKANKHGLI
jgi:transcriptional regulator with PAS, ATPase and Fis domain